MPKLPVISGSTAVVAFKKAGWNVERRAKSHHIIMKRQDWITTLSIPEHDVLDRGLLRSLIRDAGLTVEEFTELLG
jgi:predicted RNA binding protein YcfA (HicA-like mRNA interferase family)